jgi:hypothetical protein
VRKGYAGGRSAPHPIWDRRTLLRFSTRIGSLPPVGALDRLRAANGDDGFVGRARSNPRLVVAIAGGAVLVLAWIGWAIYVTSDHGARAGLGVVIAWPAALAALALISLPFIGGYLLIRRLSATEGDESAGAGATEAEQDEEEESDQDEEESEQDEDAEEDEDAQEGEDSEGEDSEDEPESDSEAEASAAS